MKVLLHYEDNENLDSHKSLKITLPKSWKTGPTSKLVGQFVETYNSNEAFSTSNPLIVADLHLAIRAATSSGGTQLQPLASDAVVLEVLSDRADVYVMHGPAPTLADQAAAAAAAVPPAPPSGTNCTPAATASSSTTTTPLMACTHFGCKKRFPRDGPFPDCVYHAQPPVFHETAKYWACCPGKKAYDWEDFENIPGCQTGTCTQVKPAVEKMFLGGADLREAAGGGAIKLKSIDDFNKAQAAGGADAAPVLDRLQKVLLELGMEKELYQQVMQGFRTQIMNQHGGPEACTLNEAELLEAVKKEMGDKLKQTLKDIAAQQLRIS